MRIDSKFISRTLCVLASVLSLAVAPALGEFESNDAFSKVKPILEENCLACHRVDQADGGLDLSNRSAAFQGGDSGPAIVPNKPQESSLYTTAVAEDADELMPPADAGGPLSPSQIATLHVWIKGGATWPEGVTLQAREKASKENNSPDNRALLKSIHELIVRTAKKETAQDMSNYEATIPKTGVRFQMVAIPAGRFLMGSPSGELQREENEGPQMHVSVKSFWIGKHEVTWDEYEPFMVTEHPREKNGARADYDPEKHGIADAVSSPTAPYMEMSFGMGQSGYPAISMTQHAANKYCQWLSAQTGHFYRLPTEAEWEYACRAGTTTAYSFGNDANKIDEYAWYYENSNEKYQKVGTKKPNPWGLHDMHGNVMEWTADQFHEDYFTRIKESSADPILKPVQLYPRSVRGGGWDDDAERLRSAARRGSESEWKDSDPQLPQSIWYHTDAQWLGFRVVRSAVVPTIEELDFYWNSATGAK